MLAAGPGLLTPLWLGLPIYTDIPLRCYAAGCVAMSLMRHPNQV